MLLRCGLLLHVFHSLQSVLVVVFVRYSACPASGNWQHCRIRCIYGQAYKYVSALPSLSAVRGQYEKHFSCHVTTEDLLLKYITGSKDSPLK